MNFIRIAHISDLHLTHLKWRDFNKFFNRRILGGINLLTFRKGLHTMRVMEALLKSLKEQKYDHIVISGDLTNLSLPTEFKNVKSFISLLGDYDKITPIPGNHDRYAKESFEEKVFESYFGDYLWNWDDKNYGRFPVLKKIDFVNIFCLDSTCPTPPALSYGIVEKKEIEEFEKLIRFSKKDNFNILLIHHNLHRRGIIAEMTARLLNRDEIISIILKNDLHLVLHGHNHTPYKWNLIKNGKIIPIISTGSSTAETHSKFLAGKYNIYSINKKGYKIQTFVYDKEMGKFIEMK